MLYLPSLKKKACTNPAAIHFIMLTDVRQVTFGVRASSDYSTINRNNVKRACVYIYIFLDVNSVLKYQGRWNKYIYF